MALQDMEITNIRVRCIVIFIRTFRDSFVRMREAWREPLCVDALWKEPHRTCQDALV